MEENPKIAVEVLIGHGVCHVIAETSVTIPNEFVQKTVDRILGYYGVKVIYDEHPQDSQLADNQSLQIRCGDNGIFKGTPVTEEQDKLAELAAYMWWRYKSDGKYILDGEKLIICQSMADQNVLESLCQEMGYADAKVNPLGFWTGGIDTDTGATNRKLGSDMGDSVTGGGLFGKDLSKADVSVNIYLWLLAQRTGETVKLSCAIGDSDLNGIPYSEIVEIAREYIKSIGGFEKFAEWGLIRYERKKSET